MNIWKRFKRCSKKLWYFLIGREYKDKVGWVSLPPQALILNDEFIHIIELKSESNMLE